MNPGTGRCTESQQKVRRLGVREDASGQEEDSRAGPRGRAGLAGGLESSDTLIVTLATVASCYG